MTLGPRRIGLLKGRRNYVGWKKKREILTTRGDGEPRRVLSDFSAIL
jgi:hypothetical protein